MREGVCNLRSWLLLTLALVACAGESKKHSAETASAGAPGENADAAAACAPDTADCNLDPTDGCEVDLTRDGDHCGACDSSCGMAVCVAGQCGVAPTLLADGQAGISSMTTDGATLFWANWASGRLLALSIGDGTVSEPVVRAQVPSFSIVDMAVDDDALFVASNAKAAEGGGILRMPKTDGPLERIVNDTGVSGITLGADRVYWTRSSQNDFGAWTGAVLRADKDGVGVATLANVPGLSVASDDDALYFAEPRSAGVERLSLDGSASSSARSVVAIDPVELAHSASMPYGVKISGGQVYWVDETGLFRVPSEGGSSETVALSAGESTNGGDFTFDGDAIYCAVGHEITRLEGGVSTPIARIETSIGGIVTAGGYLYWGDFSVGTIWRIAL
jgi:hypothetical protein